jgi:Ca2+-binding RTX toxin-like protein
MANIIGTSASDFLNGPAGDDTVRGLAGNDLIFGNDGHDDLYGDSGNDELEGGAGIDFLEGGSGDDLIEGGSDGDFVFGGSGNDTVYGGAGDDYFDAGHTAEASGRRTDSVVRVNGGAGYDTIFGALSGGTLVFADYRDSASEVIVLLGSDGTATDGRGGFDTLIDVDGAIGSMHDDNIFEDIDFGSIIEGLGGNDTLGGVQSEVRYSDSPSGVRVDLDKGTARDGWGDVDKLIGFPRVTGSNFNDSVKGSILDEEFEGLDGNDTFRGGAAGSLVDFDWIRYFQATGAVSVDLGAGTAQGIGGSSGIGNDTFFLVDGARGSDFNDVLKGGGAGAVQVEISDIGELIDIGGALLQSMESFEGRAGNDTLNGGDTSPLSWDSASYAHSPFAVIVNLGAATEIAGEDVAGRTALDGYGVNGLKEGKDRLVNINGAEGSAFNDFLIGSSGADRLFGAGGDDSVNGGAGNDMLDGGAGGDTLIGGSGNDIFLDSEGFDHYFGEAGDDIFGAYDTTFDSVARVTGGDGRDAYVVDPACRLFDITDFQPGAGGDLLYAGHVLVGAALDGLFTGSDPISLGYILFEQEGADTHVSMDFDGADGAEAPVLFHLLLDTNASDLTFDNVGGLLLGGEGSDNLQGSGFGEVLVAAGGDDTINGAAGQDTMSGGIGDDLYYVDDADDLVIEDANAPEGLVLPGGEDGPGQAVDDFTDTVIAAIDYSLANLQNVENLTIAGTAARGSGNGLDNVLKGNAGSDTLDGGAGNDTLDGGAAADRLIGGTDNDVLAWGAGDRIDGGAGTDTLKLKSGNLNLLIVRNADLKNIEQIDMTGSNNNTLTLNRGEVLAISSSTDTLTVLGNNGDVVNAAGFTRTADSGDFNRYTSGLAILLVESDVTVVI